MPELFARKIYKEAAADLFAVEPPSLQELFNNAAVRNRVGQIITESVCAPGSSPRRNSPRETD
jgi:hypothetical protein